MRGKLIMDNNFKAKDIIKYVFLILQNKEKVENIIKNVSVDDSDESYISVCQELLNFTFKEEILNGMQVDGFEINFNENCIFLKINKKFFGMGFLNFNFDLKISNININFKNGIYELKADYTQKLEDMVAQAKNTFAKLYINNTFRFINITDTQIHIDFLKIEEFGGFVKNGFFGINFIDAVDIEFVECESGYVKLFYKLI